MYIETNALACTETRQYDSDDTEHRHADDHENPGDGKHSEYISVEAYNKWVQFLVRVAVPVGEDEGLREERGGKLTIHPGCSMVGPIRP